MRWQTNYQRRIQAPMIEHREDMAEKFAGTHSEKICPVSAFGVGVAEKLFMMPRRIKKKSLTKRPNFKRGFLMPPKMMGIVVEEKKSEYEECIEKLEFINETCDAVMAYLQVVQLRLEAKK